MEVLARGMLRWTVHLEGGPRRVNHAAVAVGHKVYSFGGYCSGEDYETLRQIDVHVFNTGEAGGRCYLRLSSSLPVKIFNIAWYSIGISASFTGMLHQARN